MGTRSHIAVYVSEKSLAHQYRALYYHLCSDRPCEMVPRLKPLLRERIAERPESADQFSVSLGHHLVEAVLKMHDDFGVKSRDHGIFMCREFRRDADYFLRINIREKSLEVYKGDRPALQRRIAKIDIIRDLLKREIVKDF